MREEHGGDFHAAISEIYTCHKLLKCNFFLLICAKNPNYFKMEKTPIIIVIKYLKIVERFITLQYHISQASHTHQVALVYNKGMMMRV